MADIVLNITVPSDKVTVAAQGFLKVYPNTEKVDPLDALSDLKYTTKQWVEEKLRRVLIRDITRGLQMISNEENAIKDDDSIAIIT